jgi:hypothetical protein
MLAGENVDMGRYYQGESAPAVTAGNRAFNYYLTLVVFHDFMNNCQPQAGALLTCGKKRFKYFVLLFCRYAGTVVFHP